MDSQVTPGAVKLWESSRQSREVSRQSNDGYDNNAQLTNSLEYTSGGTPMASEQLGFAYDGGWNMTGRAVNGTPTTLATSRT